MFFPAYEQNAVLNAFLDWSSLYPLTAHCQPPALPRSPGDAHLQEPQSISQGHPEALTAPKPSADPGERGGAFQADMRKNIPH